MTSKRSAPLKKKPIYHHAFIVDRTKEVKTMDISHQDINGFL